MAHFKERLANEADWSHERLHGVVLSAHHANGSASDGQEHAYKASCLIHGVDASTVMRMLWTPSFRYEYDPLLAKIDVTEQNDDNTVRTYSMRHEFHGGCLLNVRQACCVKAYRVSETSAEYVVAHTVDWALDETPSVPWARMDISGWKAESLGTVDQPHTLLTYLIQMDFRRLLPRRIIKRIMAKQMMCVFNVADLLSVH